MEIFRILADSGPMGREVRFHAVLLIGLYGGVGRACSAGYDSIVVDNWGDVLPCTSYADTKADRLGSVWDPGFPALREDPCAPCQYAETCHQREEYGNLKILSEHRDLGKMNLNCVCGEDKEVDALFESRMARVGMARHTTRAGHIGTQSHLTGEPVA
jgi:radical SAM protein with 4Fe4S-binding SPASM domain